MYESDFGGYTYVFVNYMCIITLCKALLYGGQFTTYLFGR